MKLKIGDKVKIAKCIYDHGFPIGTVVTVAEKPGGSLSGWIMTHPAYGRWYVWMKEVKPIKNSKTKKTMSSKAKTGKKKTVKKTLLNLKRGDFVIDSDGNKRKVISVLNPIVFLSRIDDLEVVSVFYTTKELEKYGYKPHSVKTCKCCGKEQG